MEIQAKLRPGLRQFRFFLPMPLRNRIQSLSLATLPTFIQPRDSQALSRKNFSEMESSRPFSPNAKVDDQTPLPLHDLKGQDLEAQFNSDLSDDLDGGAMHRSLSQHPSRLGNFLLSMLSASYILTFVVSFAVYHWQFLCAIYYRGPKPDILLRGIKFTPLVFISLMTSELAAFTWWWLQGLRCRRDSNRWFTFPVYRVLDLLILVIGDFIAYWFPPRQIN